MTSEQTKVEEVVEVEVEVESEELNLSFSEKIQRSNTNNSLIIPNLSYLNYVLSKIELEDNSNNWEFEAVVKSGNVELVKLAPAFFKHHRQIDLSKYQAKTEEGDKLEFIVKPKHAKTDFVLKINYTYEPSDGSLYYQNTFRLTDLEDTMLCTLMQDITQNVKPTRLEILAGSPGAVIQSVELEPKFVSEEFSGEEYHYTQTVNEGETSNSMVIDFTKDDFPDGVINLLQFYRLNLKVEFSSQQHVNMDTPIHFLAYGFKN